MLKAEEVADEATKTEGRRPSALAYAILAVAACVAFLALIVVIASH
jgi:hypothetical protein